MIELIDELIARHHLLGHPFYRAWTEGRLSRDTLKLYACQYYHHVRAFPEHLRQLADRVDGELKEIVLDNWREEMDPVAPHPALWRDFAASLGVEQESLADAKPLPGVQRLVQVYGELVESGSPAEAVAALYVYEAQVPEIATQKREGLQRFYGLTDAKGVAYFSVHEEADVRHREAWSNWLAHNCADWRQAAASAQAGLQALWGALDAIYATSEGTCTAA